VREAFFQAVSNSTWANNGYLVAREIQGAETMNELRILAGLHGIGFILLDFDAPGPIDRTQLNELGLRTRSTPST